MRFRRIRRSTDGDYELSLDPQDREGLAQLAEWLRQRLLADTTAPAVHRLFPPAYSATEDEDREREYQALMRDELLEQRLAQLDVLEQTAGADRLDEEQLVTWMAAINSIRLVLGTELDVHEEDDPFEVDPGAPDAGLWLVYGVLGDLLGEVVDALGQG